MMVRALASKRYIKTMMSSLLFELLQSINSILYNIYIAPSTLCSLANEARALSPPRPFFLIEGYYENDQYTPSDQVLRAQTY